MKKIFNFYIKKIIFYIFIICIIYYFSKTLIENFDKIKNYDFSFHYGYLILSFFVFFLFYLSLVILWKNILATNINFRTIFYISSVGWMGRYIPGKIAMIISKVLMLKKYNISKKRSFVSCYYDTIFQIITAFLLSIPFLLLYLLGDLNGSYIVFCILFFILCLIFIHPKIFYFLINKFFKILKKPGLEKEHILGFKDILKYLIGYNISNIIKGLSFLFLVLSITNVGIENYLYLIFCWIFAGVIGIIAIFAPSGIGVREGILVLLLKGIFPLEIAILISILSRIWATIFDLFIGLYLIIEKYYYKL